MLEIANVWSNIQIDYFPNGFFLVAKYEITTILFGNAEAFKLGK